MMKELTLEITNHCVSFCSWCSSSSTAQYDNRTEMSYQKAFKLLDKYANECDVVRISGGEPTSHSKLLTILKHAKELHYRVVLLTNGYGIKKVISSDLVDEYVVNVVDEHSLEAVDVLKYLGKNVSLHAVLADGNKKWILAAIRCSFEEEIPLRLLALQEQGKARLNTLTCNKPLDLLSWTGDKGCNKDGKITVTWDGIVATCSALKYKDKCNLECVGGAR